MSKPLKSSEDVSPIAGALKGIRVLDASRVLAGPFCTQILSDLGADVIKIEEPSHGDDTRSWGPPYQGSLSAYFLSCNRGKRSVTLNLKTQDGRDLFHQLCAKADIIIENFLPKDSIKLGLSAEILLKKNPRLILCRLSGFGRTAKEDKNRPGYDFVIQAMSGMMAMNGAVDHEPHKFGVAIADIVTGLYAATGLQAALYQREKTGEGAVLDIALIDCAVSVMANVVQAHLVSGKNPKRQGNAHLQIVPYQLFQVKNGYLVLAIGNDTQWQRFCDDVNLRELGIDPRFATNPLRLENREILVPILQQKLLTKTKEEWEKELTERGVPCGPVWNFSDFFSSSLASRRGLVMVAKTASGDPLPLIRSPFYLGGEEVSCPPELGQHTKEVLDEWLGNH